MESSQPEGAAISAGDDEDTEALAEVADFLDLFPFPLSLDGSEVEAPASDFTLLEGAPGHAPVAFANPPASRASIDALRTVCAGEDGLDEDCAICLEVLGAAAVKELPCGRHRFHGGCVEGWLSMQGSCPLCRFRLPAEWEEDETKKAGDGEVRGGGERDHDWPGIIIRTPFSESPPRRWGGRWGLRP